MSTGYEIDTSALIDGLGVLDQAINRCEDAEALRAKVEGKRKKPAWRKLSNQANEIMRLAGEIETKSLIDRALTLNYACIKALNTQGLVLKNEDKEPLLNQYGTMKHILKVASLLEKAATLEKLETDDAEHSKVSGRPKRQIWGLLLKRTKQLLTISESEPFYDIMYLVEELNTHCEEAYSRYC